MNKKRIAGFVFIILGIALFLRDKIITGGIIGVADFSYINFIAVGFFIIGIFMLIETRGLEGLIAENDVILPNEIVERLNSISPDKKKTLVLDTSFIRAYTVDGANTLLDSLKNYDQIIVPRKVIEELRHQERKNPSLASLSPILEKYQIPSENFKRYRDPARSYLKKSRKNMYYNQIMPILLGEKSPPQTRKEARSLKEETRKVLGILKREKLPLDKKNLGHVLDHFYKVSETDVDVLAASLAEVRRTNRPVILAGKDIDLKDAVKEIRNKHPRKVNWGLLTYLTPYAYQGP